MKYTVKPSTKFQKDLKRVEKRGYNLALLTEVIKSLANGEELPAKYRDHNLSGNYVSCRECRRNLQNLERSRSGVKYLRNNVLSKHSCCVLGRSFYLELVSVNKSVFKHIYMDIKTL